MELICPAGGLPALKQAVANGADAVYLGFQDATNARYFKGLNFTPATLEKGIRHARENGCQVYLAINTYPRAGEETDWYRALDRAAALGVDALILADTGLLAHCAREYPQLRLHLSVQASATNLEALRFYAERFGVRRAVLPRVLSLDQVRRLAGRAPCELEVFGFGSLCIMAEGRCHLSSYVTGESPNSQGVCSPAKAVAWEEDASGLSTRLNGVLIDRYEVGERAAYPTLCKGRFDVNGRHYHALEEPTSLNTLELLPALHRVGVAAIKLEGRQRSPSYVGKAVAVWRRAIDACLANPDGYRAAPEWLATLGELSEGSQTTLGAYERTWQ